MNIEDRWWRNSAKGDGCWEWTGAIKTTGYGTIRYQGKLHSAHRIAAMLYKGFELDSDKVVCHTCDNRKCVAPHHLFIGTQSDNMRDMISKRKRG